MNNKRKYYVENIIKAKRYLVASIVVAAAGGVYELFSHGVYSNYMVYAFMIPLIMGCLPYLADGREIIKNAGPVSETLLLASISTLTAGSLIKGVLEIYGTTNALTGIYIIAGALLLVLSVMASIRNRIQKRNA